MDLELPLDDLALSFLEVRLSSGDLDRSTLETVLDNLEPDLVSGVRERYLFDLESSFLDLFSGVRDRFLLELEPSFLDLFSGVWDRFFLELESSFLDLFSGVRDRFRLELESSFLTFEVDFSSLLELDSSRYTVILISPLCGLESLLMSLLTSTFLSYITLVSI